MSVAHLLENPTTSPTWRLTSYLQISPTCTAHAGASLTDVPETRTSRDVMSLKRDHDNASDPTGPAMHPYIGAIVVLDGLLPSVDDVVGVLFNLCSWCCVWCAGTWVKAKL